MIDAWFSSSEHTSTSAAGERGEHAEVRREAGGEQHGRLGALPGGQGALELGVHRAAPDDEPRRAGPGTPTVERIVRGGHDLGVLGESEVVVRRELHHRPAVGRERPGRPGGVEVTRRAPLPGGAHACRLAVAQASQSAGGVTAPPPALRHRNCRDHDNNAAK